MSAQRYRKISPNEWLYLASSKHFAPFAIQLWIAGDALPTLQEMRTAVSQAAASNAGARLVPKGKWWVDSGIAPAVRELPQSERFSLSHPAVHAPLPFVSAAPFEIVCWAGTGILFRCAHALMDAGGLLYFAEEVFRALRGEALTGSSAVQSDRDYVLALKHPAARTSLRPNRKSPLGPPTPGQTGFVWERRSIPGRITATAARLASAITQLPAPAERAATCRFMFPVDLRKLDGAVRTTANLSNPIFLDLPGGVDWTDVYARTLEAFAAHEERATSRLDAMASWVPMPLLATVNHWEHEREVRQDNYLFSGLVSHIGAITFSSLSCPAFKPHSAFFLPFDAPGSALTLVTVQHDHGLEIAASCPTSTGQDGRLARAMDLICAQLQLGQAGTAAPHPAPTCRPATGALVHLPANLTVCALLVEQATASPARIALVDGAQRLTYGELLRLARLGARRLQASGVAPGDKVAILSERSADSIVAVFAIFLAGAAFVPLDPDWPAERIQFVLADCRPSCVVAADGLAAAVPAYATLPVSALFAASANDTPGDSALPADALAYVLYTSGSTGRPKGVMVGHESLVNYVLWARDAYRGDLGAPFVFPFYTSLAFDLTLTSIFLPLATGGAIHVFRQGEPLSAIAAILADPAINAVKLTPSHLWLFWGAGMAGCAIRKLIVGGEALPVTLAREIGEQSTQAIDIFNEYGPTEATVGCVVHRFDAASDGDVFVPIGLPIANTEVLLLDTLGKPVPDGTPGEIVLAGRCLAHGYLGRPDEDLRFGPHPLRPDARIYRTGDIGVRRPNGEFDYRGRADEQVKIRGHRVELGEVEAAIERTGLASTFAVLAEASPSGTHLVAYVVWRPDAGEEALRQALAAALPGYMNPARIVAMEKIPLNVNGKIDKSALQSAQDKVSVLKPDRTTVLSPDADMESELVQMIVELAGSVYATVPHDESLLELGLDSLEMMLLITLAAKRFLPSSSGKTLLSDLGPFLRQPTIVNLAAQLRRAA